MLKPVSITRALVVVDDTGEYVLEIQVRIEQSYITLRSGPLQEREAKEFAKAIRES